MFSFDSPVVYYKLQRITKTHQKQQTKSQKKKPRRAGLFCIHEQLRLAGQFSFEGSESTTEW